MRSLYNPEQSRYSIATTRSFAYGSRIHGSASDAVPNAGVQRSHSTLLSKKCNTRNERYGFTKVKEGPVEQDFELVFLRGHKLLPLW